MRLKAQDNPFTPGFGELPPLLAGRQEVQNAFAVAIKRLVTNKSSRRAILLTGPRGCGKTALLEAFMKLAADNDLDIFELERGNLPDTSTKLAELIRTPPVKRSRTTTGKAGLSRVVEADASHSVTDEPWGPSSPDLLDALLERASEKPLILLLDETHEVPTGIIHDLFKAVQAAARHHPVMIAAAGTPDTRLHLLSSGITFVERIQTHSVGRLDDAGAVQAITGPFDAAGMVVDPDTAVRAALEAQNYPYFLQCVGQSLWNAAASSGSERIDDAVLDQALPAAGRTMLALYRDRTSLMKQHAMLAGVAELALASPSGVPDRVAVKSLIKSLARRWQLSGTPPPRNLAADEPERSAEQLLLHTGFVWQPESELWEFGVPPLAAHVSLAATEDIRDTMAENQAGPVLKDLLQRGFAYAATREALFVDAAQILDGQQELAERFVNDMTAMGAIGPDGTHSPDGEPNLALLTPRVAAAALDAPEQAAA